jgi:hypothetical protein
MGQDIHDFFFDILTLETGTDMQSRNVPNYPLTLHRIPEYQNPHPYSS